MRRSVHGIVGIVDNDATAAYGDAPSVLLHARSAGLSTAAVYARTPMGATIEADATTGRIVFDSGYEASDDEVVTSAALDDINEDLHDARP